MQRFNYFRSSASYRLRIALALKRLDDDDMPVHLTKGEQPAESRLRVSAPQLVPLLRDGDAMVIQSLAIIEYLNETHPAPRLLPADALGRVRVRALAQDIACDIHPLNKLRVLRHPVRGLKVSEDDKNHWHRHWLETRLEGVACQLAAQPARYCHGDSPTLADCTLVPQVVNALRFDCRTERLPNVMRMHAARLQRDAFTRTQPSACPDAA